MNSVKNDYYTTAKDNEQYNQHQLATGSSDEVTNLILSNLALGSCPSASLTCRRWNKLIVELAGNVIKEANLWRSCFTSAGNQLDKSFYTIQIEKLNESATRIKKTSLKELQRPDFNSEADANLINILAEVDKGDLDAITAESQPFKERLLSAIEAAKRIFKGIIILGKRTISYTDAINLRRDFSITPAGKTFIDFTISSDPHAIKKIELRDTRLYLWSIKSSKGTLLYYPNLVDIQMLTSKEFDDTLEFSVKTPLFSFEWYARKFIKGPLHFKLKLVRNCDSLAPPLTLKETIEKALQMNAEQDVMEPRWTFLMPKGQGFDRNQLFS